MSRQWTPGQTQAINEDFQGNALVSASAGSGKTSVLTQRVMRKVNDGIDVDRLLIVTFTNAAAKEMRDRINAALHDAVNEAHNPEQKQFYLQQIRKLTTAHIETMDAFCQWLVKKYYYVIGLDPDFRILTDRSELGMIRDNVWSDVREDLYANDQDGSFAALTRNFSNDRNDDGLTDVLMQLYDFANVNENPEQWLNQLVDFYQIDGNLSHSKLYRQYLLPAIQNKIEQLLSTWEQMLDKANEAGIAKIVELLEKEIKRLQDLKTTVADDLSWNDIRQSIVDFQWEKRMPTISKKDLDDDQLEVKKQITDIRKNSKLILKKVADDYFFADEKDNIDTIEAAQKLVKKLTEVVQTFREKYAIAKKKKHAYEFIDIEHFALHILTSDSDEGQNIRHDFQQYLNEIMVDEYQDNNHLQDAILTAIKNPEQENMFMVGDVKQSIYRFRLADPQMFMDKFAKYPQDENNTLITLPDNFRSVKNVDDFTNLVFSQIMDQNLGEIDYTGDANLKFGALDYPDDIDSTTEIMLYKDDEQDLVTENGDQMDNEQQQIEMVAEKIDKLIQDHFQIYDRKKQMTRDIQYGDIAILSSTKRNNFDISNLFADHQIPVTIDGSESYFKTTEVQIMISLLQIIDNPFQDIPLAAVLRSPIVGMDENQMAYLRITQRMGNYFQSVLDFKQHYGDHETTEFGNIVLQKVELFLTQLQDFKDYSVKHSLAELIWYIYDQTGFLDYVGGMPAGKKCQANLHALYQRAEEYERNGFKGLFAFVQFVKRLQGRDEDLAEASVETNSDAVSVKTIHGSKGLEYPVIFLLDATHGFNRMDMRNSFNLDDDLGIGIQYYNSKRHEKVPTLQYRAISNLAEKRMLAEEMRKLYVALTRAKQKLIITGIAKHTSKTDSETQMIESWNKATQSDALVLQESLRSGANNFMDWIGPALVRHPLFNQDHDTDLLNNDETDFKIEFLSKDDLQQTIIAGKTESENELKTESVNPEAIKKIMEFKYQYPDATRTTAYQSVSEIKRQFDDPDNIELASVSDAHNLVLKNTRYNSDTFAQPKFMQSVAAPSPSDIGTATHLVLQKIDVYQPVDNNVVQELIAKLVNEKLLTPEVAKKIDTDAIVAFYQTDIGQQILAHPERLHREVPFSLIINANQLFSEFKNDSEQKLLVHGIIDGYLDDSDKGPIIFDYKTSFVNPENPETDIEKIKTQYEGQINIYAKALQDILGRKDKITEKYLYLLSTHSLLPI
ncbi:helicase-exonuclease AddAB subunit AddA [Fructilactobacillus lindneri]|uniref:ATP-dependent helicase/nuclease subunit A n=2 Tax=Fructilactobacillus lindneri TaxID=53444 RepID=A0A0R2JR17_9LACO|nr:helicase-exonuclease AddAB subunit AddA [Fructilactobacillus lindneri]ANZ58872.1 helicase-exonuclease AddAB subunit AddA [Fructilactobacillus lindneri]KRN79567.1 ATP-dependent helicase nuclease subunit A [Fructilactobacillus lindneri DSM 20690 = JCM 11027]POG97778.1 helicase-exonuclease AddAB subunit AddA [Fructilactobacillus lindneri]POH00021.1 helicase-exonuclease AddAB subunit AddA [Fructilactobacillus lindneri]POH02448.1 helicase-exonuclease AddAB subunit AddA [Fructilactobacillus lindn